MLDARSAIRWPERINVPVLLMNGAADPQVSPSHAMALATAFDSLRKPYELKIFYGEGHISPRRATERVVDIHRWFGRFDEAGNQRNGR